MDASEQLISSLGYTMLSMSSPLVKIKEEDSHVSVAAPSKDRYKRRRGDVPTDPFSRSPEIAIDKIKTERQDQPRQYPEAHSQPAQFSRLPEVDIDKVKTERQDQPRQRPVAHPKPVQFSHSPEIVINKPDTPDQLLQRPVARSPSASKQKRRVSQRGVKRKHGPSWAVAPKSSPVIDHDDRAMDTPPSPAPVQPAPAPTHDRITPPPPTDPVEFLREVADVVSSGVASGLDKEEPRLYTKKRFDTLIRDRPAIPPDAPLKIDDHALRVLLTALINISRLNGYCPFSQIQEWDTSAVLVMDRLKSAEVIELVGLPSAETFDLIDRVLELGEHYFHRFDGDFSNNDKNSQDQLLLLCPQVTTVILSASVAEQLYGAATEAGELYRIAQPTCVCVDFDISSCPDIDLEVQGHVYQPVIVDAMSTLISSLWPNVETVNFHKTRSVLPSLQLPVKHRVFYAHGDDPLKTVLGSPGVKGKEKQRRFASQWWAPIILSEARRVLRARRDGKPAKPAKWEVYLGANGNTLYTFEALFAQQVGVLIQAANAIESSRGGGANGNHSKPTSVSAPVRSKSTVPTVHSKSKYDKPQRVASLTPVKPVDALEAPCRKNSKQLEWVVFREDKTRCPSCRMDVRRTERK